MSKTRKTLDRILRGTSDANIGFADLVALLRHLGFEERVRGSHHIFAREGVEEILNLQPRGNKAKAYQVKQVRVVILNHRLASVADAQAASDRESRKRNLRVTSPDEPASDEHDTANSGDSHRG